MKSFTKVAFVSLLVSCLVLAQNTVLMAQSQASEEKVVSTEGLKKAAPAAQLAPLVAIAANLPSSSTAPASMSQPAPVPNTPAPNPPQSTGTPQRIGLIAGLALTGAGVGLLAAGEPTHQTTCVTYGICPVPGPMHVTGGILVGVGVPLTIFRLIKH